MNSWLINGGEGASLHLDGMLLSPCKELQPRGDRGRKGFIILQLDMMQFFGLPGSTKQCTFRGGN